MRAVVARQYPDARAHQLGLGVHIVLIHGDCAEGGLACAGEQPEQGGVARRRRPDDRGQCARARCERHAGEQLLAVGGQPQPMCGHPGCARAGGSPVSTATDWLCSLRRTWAQDGWRAASWCSSARSVPAFPAAPALVPGIGAVGGADATGGRGRSTLEGGGGWSVGGGGWDVGSRIRWVVRCVGACWLDLSGRSGAGGPAAGTNTEDQSRPPLRIADCDRLTIADVDRRHPGAVDEDAVGAPIDGHPMGTAEPQHKNRARGLRCRGGVARAIQRNVALAAVPHNHVAARVKDVPHRSDPHGQGGG